MRILAFMGTYGRAIGADLMSGEILRLLAANGHSVTVFSDLVLEPFTDEGVEVKPRGFYDLLKRPEADLIYCHADYGTLPYLVHKAYLLPLVYVVHNTTETTAYHVDNFPPTYLLWNSESTKERIGGGRGMVVRPTVRFPDAPQSKGDAVTMVNLSIDKGVETFAEVVANYGPDAPHFLGVAGAHGTQCDVAGAEVVGPYPAAEMSERVWQRTSVFLSPSHYESWGMAAVEALCHGVPVIASRTPGLAESLGDAGVLLDSLEGEAWIEALKALLSDKPRLAALRRKSRARARKLSRLATEDRTRLISLFSTADLLTP